MPVSRVPAVYKPVSNVLKMDLCVILKSVFTKWEHFLCSDVTLMNSADLQGSWHCNSDPSAVIIKHISPGMQLQGILSSFLFSMIAEKSLLFLVYYSAALQKNRNLCIKVVSYDILSQELSVYLFLWAQSSAHPWYQTNEQIYLKQNEWLCDIPFPLHVQHLKVSTYNRFKLKCAWSCTTWTGGLFPVSGFVMCLL